MNRQAPRLFIGLMSGTSVDAIDAALVRITTPAPTAAKSGMPRFSCKVLHHAETKWPKKFRERLLAIMAPASTTTQELCALNMLVAEHFAHAVENLLTVSQTPRQKIVAIGSHGQTVCHLPPHAGKVQRGSTLQLGDPSVIATLTGITTVGNFRPADMALGGQGAPLVPWTDAILISHPTISRAVQNIGGIANITFLPASPAQKVMAFDTGPGNMLIDAAISHATHGKAKFDKNGRRAARGILNQPLFNQLRAHPYFERRPPKSTGREDFGAYLAERILSQFKHIPLEDLLHTLTRLTAWSIADACLAFLPELPQEMILCGGGADNPTLTALLAAEFAAIRAPVSLRRIDDFGIPNKSKEAASFALLAAATLDGIPASLPSATGATRPTILGSIAHQ